MKIYLAETPQTNGHEQFSFRPILLISQLISEISLIIPFISNILALRFFYTSKIESSLKKWTAFYLYH